MDETGTLPVETGALVASDLVLVQPLLDEEREAMKMNLEPESPLMIEPTRARYPSDITDAQWKQIDLLIPPEKERGRHRTTDVREVVNAINYRWSTGCVWRMLPHDFPPWATVYTYFRRWQRDGTLRQIREVLLRRSGLPVQAASDRHEKSRARIPGPDDTRTGHESTGGLPTSEQYPVPAA